jgi:hypothetical protein
MSICACQCFACRFASVMTEGPLGVIDDYEFGACECGLPTDDDFYVSEADDPGQGEDDGSGVVWLIHTECGTRWYGRRGAFNGSDDWKEEPSEAFKLRLYREISGESPSWVGDVIGAKHDEAIRLIQETSGRDHVWGLCEEGHR